MKHIVLAPQLEQSLLSAMLGGLVAPSLLSAEELSKDGRSILKSIKYLLKHGAQTPLKPSAVQFTAIKIFGSGRGSTAKYVRGLGKVDVEADAQAIVKAARSKEALVKLINEASEQLSQGDFDRSRLSSLVGRETWAVGKLTPLADEISKGFKKPPRGISLPDLPIISQATNGFRGMWIVGGEPGVGKSTFAWQIALTLAKEIPILYYDLDGTGLEDLVERTRMIFGGSKKKAMKAMKRFYYREDIAQIDNDLNLVKSPALIVVDSMQTLPTNLLHRRSSLDKWLVDFKQIVKRGYPMFIVSEVGRGSYGKVYMESFKETGELEYAGSLCARMTGDIEDDEEPIEFHILKNRHGPKHGHIINLERDSKRDWLFKEVRV
jgi:hypothetical protein